MHSFSKFVSAALAFGLLLSHVAATCTRPLQRKEWGSSNHGIVSLSQLMKQVYAASVDTLELNHIGIGLWIPGPRKLFLRPRFLIQQQDLEEMGHISTLPTMPVCVSTSLGKQEEYAS
ncbi:hypothetical protein VE02_00787 [Pseudogymnoascus sp. 03VT05]|nr:hypothetical protein VE02_00787 [Pseudogymnoascus sp. 03VT05]